jgi:hypothetical protein
VDLNLEESFLPWRDCWTMQETQRFHAPAEGDHVPGKWAAKIRGVAPGMKTAEIAIQLAFRATNASWVPNHQRSIHACHCTPRSRLGSNPIQNFVHAFQACEVAKAQLTTIQADGR